MRIRGRKCKGMLLTAAYTNGNLVKRRAAFRVFNDLVIVNEKILEEMIKNGQLSFDLTTLVTIVSWAKEATPLRVKSKE